MSGPHYPRTCSNCKVIPRKRLFSRFLTFLRHIEIMNSNRPSGFVSILRANLSSALIVAWGLGILLVGIFLGNIGHYSLHIMGGIFIAAGLCGFAYAMIKNAAIISATDPQTGAGGQAFDDGAAVTSYLKTPKRRDDFEAAKPNSAAIRPAFGRKSA